MCTRDRNWRRYQKKLHIRKKLIKLNKYGYYFSYDVNDIRMQTSLWCENWNKKYFFHNYYERSRFSSNKPSKYRDKKKSCRGRSWSLREKDKLIEKKEIEESLYG